MILEISTWRIREGTANAFESQFRKASRILSGAPGHIGHELHKCVEKADQYMLIVRWNSIADHMIGFRQSEAHREWMAQLEPYLDASPDSCHYVNIRL